jgi:secondary thiamine-phosphate synthase enzyme
MIQSMEVKTSKRNQMIDITKDIEDIIRNQQIENGYVIVFVPHTTAGVTINEGADPDVSRDIIHTFEQLIPENNSYRHAEGNSDAHIKASLFGASELILVENNQLVLGTWQHVFLYEGDGPRNRTVYVKCISDAKN